MPSRKRLLIIVAAAVVTLWALGYLSYHILSGVPITAPASNTLNFQRYGDMISINQIDSVLGGNWTGQSPIYSNQTANLSSDFAAAAAKQVALGEFFSNEILINNKSTGIYEYEFLVIIYTFSNNSYTNKFFNASLNNTIAHNYSYIRGSLNGSSYLFIPNETPLMLAVYGDRLISFSYFKNSNSFAISLDSSRRLLAYQLSNLK